MSIRFLTSGESHGKALTAVIEGIPAGLAIDLKTIECEMARRKLGFGRGERQKIETDSVEILSGVRHGLTLGSPVTLSIRNRDWDNWSEIMSVEPTTQSPERVVSIPRPGHADYVGALKYGHEDMRNVLERASARETAARVAVGTIARIFLREIGIECASRVVQIGKARDLSECSKPLVEINACVDRSPVRCLDATIEKVMIAEIERAKSEGNTLGGVFEVYVSGLPVGLGSYVQWDRRLDGKLAQAFISLNAIKGVEIGNGFQLAGLLGSEVHDEFVVGNRSGQVLRKSNRSGGIEGGMSTGEWLCIRAAMKPLSTLAKPLTSVNLKDGVSSKAHFERSDITAVPSAAVIGESLAALVIVEAVLEKFGGDSWGELLERVTRWNCKTKSN
ncbi:MAG: chorismate synthase [Bdellovibrionota bacterium]